MKRDLYMKTAISAMAQQIAAVIPSSPRLAELGLTKPAVRLALTGATNPYRRTEHWRGAPFGSAKSSFKQNRRKQIAANRKRGAS